jgi:hypothetical protein
MPPPDTGKKSTGKEAIRIRLAWLDCAWKVRIAYSHGSKEAVRVSAGEDEGRTGEAHRFGQVCYESPHSTGRDEAGENDARCRSHERAWRREGLAVARLASRRSTTAASSSIAPSICATGRCCMRPSSRCSSAITCRAARSKRTTPAESGSTRSFALSGNAGWAFTISRARSSTGARICRGSICRLSSASFSARSGSAPAGRDKRTASCSIARRYRYQQFMSDIAGQDISAHGNNKTRLIGVVRGWLQAASGTRTLPGGAAIKRRLEAFEAELPKLCRALRLRVSELTFSDYSNIVSTWLKAQRALSTRL